MNVNHLDCGEKEKINRDPMVVWFKGLVGFAFNKSMLLSEYSMIIQNVDQIVL